MFGCWVLNEIWIIDLSSALVVMLLNSSKLVYSISFFEQSSFKLRCETVIGIVLCYSHQECCLYYLCEIISNNDVIVVSDLEKNIGGSTDLAKKRHGSADLHTPTHPSP